MVVVGAVVVVVVVVVTPVPDQLVAVARPLAMIPGAPPVRVVSVAVMAVVPFSAKVKVDPVTLRDKVVPAARALTGYAGAQLGPGPAVAQEQHQLGAAEVGEVDADVDVGPSGLGPHGGADPLAAGELGGGQLDLGRLVAGIGLGGTDVTGVARRSWSLAPAG